MHKSQYYFSQCIEAASKSPMNYSLGAVLVKGGKIISVGWNHHRTHYDGNHVRTHGHRKPVSMHAEMHAIFNVTGMSPSFKQQVQVDGNGRCCNAASQPTAVRSRTCTRKRAAGKKPARDVCCTECAAHGGKAATRDVDGGQSSMNNPERSWNARRRDSRVNGADLYVVRVNKAGTGAARPCWRCVRWCSWSGVKRIFHWDPVAGRFEVLKVNSAEEEGVYETSSDTRLFAGGTY